MLAYAFKAIEKSNFEDLAGEEFDNIHNLFAAILSSGIGWQLKHGLYKEYIGYTDSLGTIRGKINIQESIRKKAANSNEIVCDFDEYSENNIYNQILKTTALVLIKSNDVKDEYRDALKKEMLYFSNVNFIDPFSINWSTLRFHRNNQSYQILISLCQLIIEGLLMTSENGGYKLLNFVDQRGMNILYEKFILEYYRKEFAGKLSANPSQISWVLDDEERTFLPVMQTDITLSKKNDILIIDAKYYGSIMQSKYENVYTQNSGNLYQMFTYVKNKEASLKDVSHRVAGLVLYAATDEERLPDNTYKMSGNEISVSTLDLGTDFKDIKKKLNGIVEKFFGIENL